MKLSVIIPCFNEGAHIARVLDTVRAVDVPKEIIVVDDGSTDDTVRVLKEYPNDGSIKIHLCEHNRGKGAAIRAGLDYVTGDIVIIQDADLEYDPQQFPEIIRPMIEDGADVVYGSRFLGSITGMRLPNRIANIILTFTANLLFRSRITDEATCYKAFKTEILKSLPLRCMRFEFCPEVTARLHKRGIEIREVPIRYVSRHRAQGKKIKWTDAFEAMWTLIKYRFVD
jgi:dolichol-phosphate mannosyltransferase